MPLLLILAAISAAAPAGVVVRTVCGVRDGTAGNASLVAGGREVIELARQGGSQRLLDEADAVVGADGHGETGTQTGARHCLRVRYDRRGEPLRVLSGRPAPPRRPAP